MKRDACLREEYIKWILTSSIVKARTLNICSGWIQCEIPMAIMKTQYWVLAGHSAGRADRCHVIKSIESFSAYTRAAAAAAVVEKRWNNRKRREIWSFLMRMAIIAAANAVTWCSLESYFIGQKILQYTQLVSPLCTRAGLYGRRTKERHEIYVAYRSMEREEKFSLLKKRDDEKDMLPSIALGHQLSTMISTTFSLVNQLVITVNIDT